MFRASKREVKGRSAEVRVVILNVGMMTGKARELADTMVKSKVALWCLSRRPGRRESRPGALEVDSNCSAIVYCRWEEKWNRCNLEERICEYLWRWREFQTGQ